MFDHFDGISTNLSLLHLHKTVLDNRNFDLRGPLDYDYEICDSIDAISCAADKVVFYQVEGFEDNSMYKITFDNMPTFYELCKKRARKMGVNFRRETYYQNAEKFVDSQMQMVGSYSLCWALVVPKKIVKKKSYYLYIETGCEYPLDYICLAEAIYAINAFYEQLTAELISEEQGKKIIPFIQAGKEKAA